MEAVAHVAKAAKARKASPVSKTSAPAAVSVAPVVINEDEIFFNTVAKLPQGTSADQIERLIEAFARIKADRARRAYDAAMIEMQPRLPIIAERGKTEKNTYALFEDVVEIVRPILSKHGFALTHHVEANGANKVRVVAILAHIGGHREETSLVLPFDTSDGKSEIHAEVSAVSYGRRITSVSILGIVSRGEDDDAKRASQSQEVEMISAEQKVDVLKLLADTGGDLPALLAMWKLASLDDVTSAKVPLLKAEIRAAAKRQAKMKEAAQ